MSPMRTLVAVAHSDDETLWAYDFIVRHPGVHVAVCSIDRRPGKEHRVERFYRACAAMGATPFVVAGDFQMWDLDPRPAVAFASGYDLIVTHNEVGEYGHPAHIRLHEALRTLGKPIVWILHASYAWIVVHLALRGLAGFGLAPVALATHALTVGAIGGLTLGMMTRTSRSHTARPLKVGPWESAAYVLVHLAALVRVFFPLIFPALYPALILASGVLWSLAFALFTVVYIPILTRPRLDGQPG